MTWFRVDDKFHGHPKVKGLKLDVIGLWSLCGSYCSDHTKLDGFVPLNVAADFAGSETKAKTLAAKLVARKLWLESDGGWRFHDWHQYQPSAEETDERRSALSAKRASAGRLGAAKRWQVPMANDGKAMASAILPCAKLMAADGPDPDPDPVPIPEGGEPPPVLASAEDSEDAVPPSQSETRLTAASELTSVRGRTIDAGERFEMPVDFPLTDESRAAAAMLGVRDVEAEWLKFRGTQMRDGRQSTAKGWYAAFTQSWCARAKQFQARDRERERAEPFVVTTPPPPRRSSPPPEIQRISPEQARQALEDVDRMFGKIPSLAKVGSGGQGG